VYIETGKVERVRKDRRGKGRRKKEEEEDVKIEFPSGSTIPTI